MRQIREKFDYAGTIEDKEQAIEIYKSIIDLYRDVKWGLIKEAEEGRTLLRKSGTEISRLRRAIIDEKEAARLAAEEAAKAKAAEAAKPAGSEPKSDSQDD